MSFRRSRRRPPTMLERAVGRRRARRIRRRVGLLLVGTGFVVMRPQRVRPAMTAAAAAMTLFAAGALVIVR